MRSEARSLRRRIEGLWSHALIGERPTVVDLQEVALVLSSLRLRVESTPVTSAAAAEVAAAREDVARCIATVADLVAHFSAT